MRGQKKTIVTQHGLGLNITAEHPSRVFVVGIDFLSDDELEENDEQLPVVVMKMDPSWHVEPEEPPAKGNYGWFPDGKCIEWEINGYTVSVKLFDRQETPEEYAYLSSDW